MYKAKLWLYLCLFTIIAGTAFYYLPKYVKTEMQENEGEEDEKEDGVDKQMAMWFQSRAYPDATGLNDKYLQGWEQAKAIREKQYSNQPYRMEAARWTSIGPSQTIGGRILSIAINPTTTSTIFVGSAGGGIWKTVNGGTLWQAVPTGFPVQGVPSIIINPSNTNIIYAGTGEVYRLDSTGTTPNPNNAGHNVWKARGTFGVGILKSTDGGTTWTQALYKKMSNLFGIQSLKFDPTNYNTVYACATDGLYRTTDAGANWTKILDKTYVSDVVINKTDNKQIVAAVGNFGNTYKGIYKSADGGTTWTKISSALPTTFQGFIRFDNLTSTGNENTIVASIGVSEATTVNELYRSTDFGSNWTVLPSSTHTQWQYWCAHDVAINPTTPNNLLYAGVKLHSGTISVTTKGNGSPTTSFSGNTIGSTHDDVHDIKFDPSNNSIIYVACDGGIWKSTNGGSSFAAYNNGLAATQFYASLGVSSTNANLFVGGLQDNGVVIYNGTTWTGFSGLTSTDGASCLISPANDQTMIASGDARNVYYSTNGGGSSSNKLSYLGGANDSRTAFVSPMAISKKKPSVVYVGSDNLSKSTDGGSTWLTTSPFTGSTPGTNYIEALHKTAIAMAVAPSDPNGDILYVSTSPFAQYDNDADNIYVTGQPNILKSTNGGATLPMTSVKGTLPDRFVMDFAISPTYSDSVFIVLAGFGTSHVYVTGNGGTTWASVGTGLPDVPFNAILIDPVNPKVIYAGGDMGVYVSPNRGATWYDYNNGFTDYVQVMDIQPTADQQLVIATHGKGAYTGPLYSGVLPVTLVSFTGTAVNDYNQLQWQVTDESNVLYYKMERSTDGNSYKEIQSQPAKNSYAGATYTYKDVDINNTSYFYRLKWVDYDGRFTYSPVVVVRRYSQQGMEVMGNPFSDRLNLRFTVAQNSKVQINIYEAGGRLVRSEQAVLNTGQSVYTLSNLGRLAAGIYTIEAIGNNQLWKQKVVKR